MAREIVLSHAGSVSRFEFQKVDRAALYGARRRIPLDRDGRPCIRASITDDGRHLLRHGMTAQGLFTASGRQVSPDELVGRTPAGEIVPRHASTLGEAQDLRPATAQEVLDLRVQSVYVLSALALDPELDAALTAGAMYAFPFSYRGNFALETGVVLRNDQGTFALIGDLAPPMWIEPATLPPPVADDGEALDDEVDFQMF